MFRELREWLHLLLLYGFLYICAIGVIVVFVANAPKNTPQPQYYATKPPEPIIQKEPSEKDLRVVEKERVCTRIEGCATYKNAKTKEEYCPTCEWVIKR